MSHTNNSNVFKNNAGNSPETAGNGIRYSIVTPSIARSTLPRLCESIDNQNVDSYEHLIIVDIPVNELDDKQLMIIASLSRKNRQVHFCDIRHMHCGNTCRHNMTKRAKGDYIFYIDDDDFLADQHVLETLDSITADWAIFPVSTCGRTIYSDPPGMCQTTTGGFLLKRGLIDWPDVPNYETDGMIVTELMTRQVPYQAIPGRSLTIHPVWNMGRYL